MVQSMTGFAREEINGDWGTLICELKSVNNRFLDLHFRLPENLRECEFNYRKTIKQAITRGKIDCTFHLQEQGQPQLLGQVDECVLNHTIQTAENIAAKLQNPSPINPLEILLRPGVLPSIKLNTKAIAEAAEKILDKALNNLIKARQREGEELKQIIQDRIDGIRIQVDIVEREIPDIRKALETRLMNRLNELDIDVNPERLEQEMVIQTQRMDVDEEVDRLKTHLKEVERTLHHHKSSNLQKPIGRRLDFLMQELNREANTLGSKSQAAVSTQVSVEIKLLIEQMREQIQNIE